MAETRDAATISRCGTYRYQLARDVSMTGTGWADVIADCAQTFLHARDMGPPLALVAERNLRRALEGWRS